MRKFIQANKVLGWFLLHFLFATISGVAFFTVGYFLLFSKDSTELFANDLLVMTPLATGFFIFHFYVAVKFYTYFRHLSISINHVANGDYDTSLDIEKAGPLKEIYQDFNIMTKELSNTQILRDDFINQFSHEFKTPITSINGFAKLLQNPDLSPKEQQTYLKIIEKESNRLTNLATNVMTLTSLESQEIVNNQKDFALEEQLRQSIIAIYPLAEKKEISIDVNLTPIEYHTNPELLQQVWTNLLNNAIKFTQKGGHITVNAWKEKGTIKVAFINDGPLIPEDKIKLLFDKFYQDDTAEKNQGLGLGLAIVKRVLELINGNITIISNKDDLTQFIVSLN
ncbi:two-component sensor histidine kinase [Streptococcus equinus]|uniref:HAMP domain-containing sensor histidine kinase n=1 Tax=Streptococcus equinus TaxID=1335 RepID=UPI000F6E9E87|nr:HAMP domain-containing sensor histidine kinase [Streptococcus equinus]VED92514.1 two-component sensor histidine kinase [Streptococcus equinus]VTS89096.1 two-component sensor histidine kinase [Streptococcus equinus]